jgi:replicative DNA helicase
MDFTFGHVMPQAPEMEEAVLGTLTIDKEAYLEVCELLRPESFYEPRNQIVYEAIQHLTMEEIPVDVMIVVNKLEKTEKLNEVGDAGYIADLSSRVATSANIEYYANVVAEKYLSRQMIHYVGVIGKKTFDETYDIKDV